MARKPIPEELYKQFHELMPIACVDLVVFNGSSVLLLERLREPEKGKFWFPGGRLMKNESIDEAIKRILFEETGLTLRFSFFLECFNGLFQADPFGHGEKTHTISLVHRVVPETSGPVKFDDDHGSFFWWNHFNEEGREIPDVVREIAERAWE